MIPGWRLCRARYADLSGQGARSWGGRWNGPGRAMVYLADHPALSVLEVRVHLDLPLEDLPDDYVLLLVSLPDDVTAETEMPANPRRAGNDWLDGLSSAVLRVPSALVPRVSNLLLNPAHRRAADAVIEDTIPFRFDERLWKGV